MATAEALLLITGGGTGGHVSPGLGVAAEWTARHGAGSVAWVGRPGGIEQGMAERAGLAFHGVDSAAFKRQWTTQNLSIPGVLLTGLRQATALIQARRPAAVLMTGGYVGAPLSLAALRARVPLVVMEPNAVPGLANRLLKPVAAKLCLGWPPEEADPAVAVTGTPCRLGALPSADAARRTLGLDRARRTLLVLPGSQAARAINAALRQALPALADRDRDWQWVWMCGSSENEEALCRQAAAAAPFPVRVHPFIQDVATAYAAADLVLCRSGASTLAELGVAGKASLQVPYPHATGDHQRANAAAFARGGAAAVVDERDLTAESLALALRSALDNPAALERMAAAARALGQPRAAAKVADEIETAAGLGPAAAPKEG